MEVKRRKVRHMAQRLHRQVTFEIGINVGEYGVEAFCVSEMGRHVGHWEKLLEVRSAIESTIAAPTRLAALAQDTFGWPVGSILLCSWTWLWLHWLSTSNPSRCPA